MTKGVSLKDVRDEEEVYLAKRRHSVGIGKSASIGVALSGGGVRAACFALGVIHWLERSGHWDRVDYVSSVSGGGYAAAGVLAASNGKVAETDGLTSAERVLAELNRDDNGYIQFSALSLVTMFVLWGVSMVLSLSWLLLLVGQSGPLVMEMFPIKHAFDRYVPGVGCVVFLLVGLYQLTASRLKKRPTSDGQLWFFLAMIFGAIQIAHLAGHLSSDHEFGPFYWAMCVVAGLLCLFVGVALSLSPGHPSIVRLHNRARYAFGFTFLLSAGLIMQAAMRNLTHHVIALVLNDLYFASLLIMVIAMSTNPNRLSLPVKIYYEGLKRKFGRGVDQPLHEVCTSERAPIHLINCFSQSPIARDDERKQRRGGENFCVSGHFCGMESSGYFPTRDWYVGKRRKSWDHQSVWRLIAISGAAFDIHPVKQSPLRNMLSTVFNMGLGVWVINPAFHPERRTWRPSFFQNTMAALNVHNNRAKWIRLSDGGHFENLGIYELAARECMDIVVVDAGHDPNYEFSDLAYAIARCWEDFEALIDIPSLFPRKTRDSVQEVILTGTIRYKGKSELGKITYIKLGVESWHSLPLRLRSSIDRHFPHEPTTNQFPTRDFVNAYYRLGEETASRALPAVMSEEAQADLAIA